MFRIQQIPANLTLVDNRHVYIRQLHPQDILRNAHNQVTIRAGGIQVCDPAFLTFCSLVVSPPLGPDGAVLKLYPAVI